jgi:hypothetical protein
VIPFRGQHDLRPGAAYIVTGALRLASMGVAVRFVADLVSPIPLLRARQTPSPASLSWMLVVAPLATVDPFSLARGLALLPAPHKGVSAP